MSLIYKPKQDYCTKHGLFHGQKYKSCKSKSPPIARLDSQDNEQEISSKEKSLTFDTPAQNLTEAKQ